MLCSLGGALLFLWSIHTVTAATNYNETEAKRLALLSAGAYSSNKKDQESCTSLLYDTDSFTILLSFDVPCDPLNNTCAVEVASEQRLYFVFAGSRGATQFLEQALSTLQPTVDFRGLGKVLNYHNTAHRLVWPYVDKFIVDPKYEEYTFVFTGHSLGATLAALSAARCAVEGFCPPELTMLYTFGEPRTGSVQFAKNLDSLIGENYRIVHGSDPITQLPICERTLGIWSFLFPVPCDMSIPSNPYHHGYLIWYKNDMSVPQSYKVCTEASQPTNCPFNFEIQNLVEYHRDYFQLAVPYDGKGGCRKQAWETKP